MSDPTLAISSCGFAMTLLIAVTALVRNGLEQRSPISVRQSSVEGELGLAGPVLPPAVPVGRVPVWFYRSYDLLGAGFVFLVYAGMAILSMGVVREDATSIHPVGLLVSIGFQFFMAGLVVLMVILRVRPVEWLGLRWVSWPWVFLIAPASVMGMWLVFAGLYASGYLDWMKSLGVDTVQDTVQLLQKSNNPAVLGLMAFAAVVAAPVCEEIVFRGYLYPVLKRFGGAWSAAFCSALLFSLAHGSLAAALPLFLFGGLLVWIYEKTGSLWAPISVHFCFNGATVVIQMASRFLHLPLDPGT